MAGAPARRTPRIACWWRLRSARRRRQTEVHFVSLRFTSFECLSQAGYAQINVVHFEIKVEERLIYLFFKVTDAPLVKDPAIAALIEQHPGFSLSFHLFSFRRIMTPRDARNKQVVLGPRRDGSVRLKLPCSSQGMSLRGTEAQSLRDIVWNPFGIHLRIDLGRGLQPVR